MHLADSSHNSLSKKPRVEPTFAAEHKEDAAEIFDEVISYGPPVISVTLVMSGFLDRFPEVSDDAAGSGFKKGLMTAMIPLGAFIGALNMGWLADWISRKRSLIVVVVIFIVGSSIQTAAINCDMLIAGRFFGGVGIGILRGLPQEDPRVRREWIDIVAEARFQAMVLKERHPRLTASPAISDKIKLEVVSWTDCFKTGCWRRTHVGVGIQAWQQWVGINALIYYSPTLFATMGLDYNMQLLMSGALNCVQLMGVLSSLWTLDRFGRRNILLLGSVFIAILVGKFSHDWPSYVTEGWVSVAFLFAFMLSFGFSWVSSHG
ncbi:hypothetical protein Brms1b_006728 [Colletotrichum noveboracense]|nr:hypothetical protein Brms1b_006728 [Colletotrichum noveboracense]